MKNIHIIIALFIYLGVLQTGFAQKKTSTSTSSKLIKSKFIVGKDIYFDNFRQLTPANALSRVLSVSAHAGTFVKPNMAVGVGIQSTKSVMNLLSKDASSTDLYGFVRQYYPTRVPHLMLYGQAQLGYNFGLVPGLSNGLDSTATQLSNGLNLGVSPGVAYFVHPQVSVDAYVSGLKLGTNWSSNNNWMLAALPKLNTLGIGFAGNVYF